MRARRTLQHLKTFIAMKKKVLRTAARRGSKRVKGISREVRVLDLHSAYGINKDALSTLMVMANPHKNAHLFYEVCDCLRGFDAHMQNQIVEALAMYYSGEAYVLTCIEHVDELLVNLYHVFDLKLMNIKNK
jgi:hypothetical protein